MAVSTQRAIHAAGRIARPADRAASQRGSGLHPRTGRMDRRWRRRHRRTAIERIFVKVPHFAALAATALSATPAPAQLSAAAQRPASAQLSATRSEEHTSELQSLMRISYAVFCLKKKNTTQ